MGQPPGARLAVKYWLPDSPTSKSPIKTRLQTRRQNSLPPVRRTSGALLRWRWVRGWVAACALSDWVEACDGSRRSGVGRRAIGRGERDRKRGTLTTNCCRIPGRHSRCTGVACHGVPGWKCQRRNGMRRFDRLRSESCWTASSIEEWLAGSGYSRGTRDVLSECKVSWHLGSTDSIRVQ
jgi:hypothetical protein